jgi:predicted transcriptional regulator
MSKEAVFTMKLEPELRDAFMAEAAHRPASQVVRDLMRQFVESQRETREDNEFLGRKVDLARKAIEAGDWRSDEDVGTEFASRRSALIASGKA